MRHEQLLQVINVLKDIQELINSGLFNIYDIADELLESGAIDNDPYIFDTALDETIEILENVSKLIKHT